MRLKFDRGTFSKKRKEVEGTRYGSLNAILRVSLHDIIRFGIYRRTKVININVKNMQVEVAMGGPHHYLNE